MKTDTAILSSDAEVSKIEHSSFTLIPSLIYSKEEANIKVMLHAKVLLENANHNLTIQSPSEDSDIVLLVILLLWKFKDLVILDDGHRKTGKSLEYLMKILNQILLMCKWAPCVLRE